MKQLEDVWFQAYCAALTGMTSMESVSMEDKETAEACAAAANLAVGQFLLASQKLAQLPPQGASAEELRKQFDSLSQQKKP